VFTSSRHEKRVSQYLTQRQIECFLPLYSAVHKWANRCEVKLELPLFTNYIFVRIDRNERVRVLEIPGVLSLVGCGREPVPLSDFEIESLRAGLRCRKIEPHPYLVMGQRARITAGALAGMEGVLVRNKNNLRVVLTLDQIMKSVAVEVDAADLEPVKTPFNPTPKANFSTGVPARAKVG
jgi:transcription antitermination factor NusG